MKYIVPLISLMYSMNCFSQTPNPNLFQTWYLYDYYSTDDNIHHPISAITPSVSPYVTFTETSSFNGVGACNSFNGTFSSPFPDALTFSNFSGTLLECGYAQHNSLEGAFFSLMQSGGQYFISGEGTNMGLLISTPIFTDYVFGNSQLRSPKFDLKQISVYPNPVNSEVFINSQNNVINKIEIFNSIGQTVKTINSGFDMVSVSDFAPGVYLIKLYSEDGTISKKIIKK